MGACECVHECVCVYVLPHHQRMMRHANTIVKKNTIAKKICE